MIKHGITISKNERPVKTRALRKRVLNLRLFTRKSSMYKLGVSLERTIKIHYHGDLKSPLQQVLLASASILYWPGCSQDDGSKEDHSPNYQTCLGELAECETVS